MHWFFAKKKTPIPVPAPKPAHKPRTKYNRISVPRPAPKTRSKSIARPRPRPLTRKARPSMGSFSSLRSQLNDMKRVTNKLRQNTDNKEFMKRFIRNGFPKQRIQNPNKV